MFDQIKVVQSSLCEDPAMQLRLLDTLSNLADIKKEQNQLSAAADLLSSWSSWINWQQNFRPLSSYSTPEQYFGKPERSAVVRSRLQIL